MPEKMRTAAAVYVRGVAAEPLGSLSGAGRSPYGRLMLRERLSYTNVVATLALFGALGGTSYAALEITGRQIQDGTVRSADLRDGDVRGRDLRDGTVSGRDIRPGSLTARQLAPGAVPAAPAGPPGPRGERGE